MKFKSCAVTTQILYQTLLSKKSLTLANQSLVPLWLGDSSLNKSSQGFTQAKENTDKHLKTDSWIMDNMLGYIRHKSQFKPRSLLHIMAGTGKQGGSSTLGLDKQNTVLVACLYLTKAVRENCLLPKQRQADVITSSKAKILHTHCWRCKQSDRIHCTHEEHQLP